MLENLKAIIFLGVAISVCYIGTPTTAGEALQGYLESCVGTHHCQEGLDCNQGMCHCPFQAFQTYDNGSQQCVTRLVGGPCQAQVNGVERKYECQAAHTECKDVTSGGLGIFECACKDGFSVTAATNCTLKYGQKCAGTMGTLCDLTAGLVCKNEVCTCPNLQEYDEKEGKCMGLVGAFCSKEWYPFCVKGAYCNLYPNGEFDQAPLGICRCKKEGTMTKERRCE